MPFPDGVPLLCLDGSGFPCSAGPTETPCGSYRAAPLHEAMYPAGLGGGVEMVRVRAWLLIVSVFVSIS